MKTIALLVLWVWCAVAYPYSHYPQNNEYYQPIHQYWQRPRRAPLQRTMMLGGYYRPLFDRRSGYEPETAMSAFALGNSVSTGSELSDNPQPCLNCPDRGPPIIDLTPSKQTQDSYDSEEPFKPSQNSEPVESPEPEQAVTEKTKKKARRPAKKEEDEIEDEEEEFDYGKRGRRPYAAFFPMFFSYGGSGGRSKGEGGMPGVTAIANSYSTARGGVATSHATAYGGPAPE